LPLHTFAGEAIVTTTYLTSFSALAISFNCSTGHRNCAQSSLSSTVITTGYSISRAITDGGRRYNYVSGCYQRGWCRIGSC